MIELRRLNAGIPPLLLLGPVVVLSLRPHYFGASIQERVSTKGPIRLTLEKAVLVAQVSMVLFPESQELEETDV
jgi:hypothetical protein